MRLPYEDAPYVQEFQGLLVLFCWANLVACLLADLCYRMEREVPTFLRELVLLAVYLYVGMTALRAIFNINMASILTTTTVLTAALAFAMQTSLANVVSGFHIQGDRNFRSGTWVWRKARDGILDGIRQPPSPHPHTDPPVPLALRQFHMICIAI